MRKFLSIIALASIILTACTPGKKVSVIGTVEGLNDGEIVLLTADGEEAGRVVAVENQFEMKNLDLVVGDGAFYKLWVPELGEHNVRSRTMPAISFMISSDLTEVKAKIEEGNFILEELIGSPMMDEYNNLFESNIFKADLEQAMLKYQEAYGVYAGSPEGQTPENMENLQKASENYRGLMESYNNYFAEMIEDNSDNIALAHIIREQKQHADIDELREAVAQFDASIKNSAPVKWFNEKIAKMELSEVGKPAPGFEFPTLEGEMVSLADLTGENYVLIDFWASWCGPCIQEIPNIVKLHEDYKDKGLTVVGVSIDRDENAWRDMVAEKELDYVQLYDGEGTTGDLYSYSGIPFIILIGPDGTILHRNLRGDHMRETISGYLD